MWSTLPISTKRRRSSTRGDATSGSAARVSRATLGIMQAPAARNAASRQRRRCGLGRATGALMRGPLSAWERAAMGRGNGDGLDRSDRIVGVGGFRARPPYHERRARALRPYYFLMVNGTEYWVVSHIIRIAPPPDVPLSRAMVNWSTFLSRVSFFISTRPSSLAASLGSS